MTPPARGLRVRSGNLALAAREHSAWSPGKASVVLVHGYPDQQDTWDEVIAALPRDELHLVTYDVRGAGCSDVPGRTADYRTELLVDDLVAVLDATVPDRGPVHLVGHDWGSVQLWDVVAAERDDPRLRGRIASFTSISGPSLDHVAWLVRRPRGRRTALARQLLHSWYVYLFHVPWLPELLWRRAHPVLAGRLAAREGLPAGRWGAALGRNGAHGVNLYRANVGQRMRRPRTLHTDVPVLVVHPTRDRYLTGVFLQDLEVACSDVRVVEVDAGHWLIATHAGVVAGLVADQVARHRT